MLLPPEFAMLTVDDAAKIVEVVDKLASVSKKEKYHFFSQMNFMTLYDELRNFVKVRSTWQYLQYVETNDED